MGTTRVARCCSIARALAPLSSNGITKLMAHVGRREVGKSLGSSLLRHSYLSHWYADVNDEKKKDAEMTMHSVANDGTMATN